MSSFLSQAKPKQNFAVLRGNSCSAPNNTLSRPHTRLPVHRLQTSGMHWPGSCIRSLECYDICLRLRISRPTVLRSAAELPTPARSALPPPARLYLLQLPSIRLKSALLPGLRISGESCCLSILNALHISQIPPPQRM